MKYFITPLLLGLLLISCSRQNSEDTLSEADRIVMESIEKSGGERYNNMDLSFRFRDRDYGARQQDGLFEYVRITTDSTGVIRDVLNNDEYYREVNGIRVDVIDSMAGKYARSVNSVIYFALLPDGLSDPAVNREYLGTKEINGKNYHKIRVTFDQEGGGDDFEDVFIYWFNTETGFFDYMAYLYYTDEGGIRFREAYNPRFEGGIRFMDFNNYKPIDSLELDVIDDAFMAGELERLSVIELEEINVKPL
ncbi:DUF6503 family protein [Fulvivirga sedimenti]|uniref:Deoxyribose-phosphate aldolase n=1 Tax=Fulvivirga sedimenti TaxID=2879465 RepID=A0A9X1HWB6_9BACT|nr:DUF6503 family protein [Fulvivirga sedimenti]MCA6079041.1 hypothetical protein [Fulvivirga sedimenti]